MLNQATESEEEKEARETERNVVRTHARAVAGRDWEDDVLPQEEKGG